MAFGVYIHIPYCESKCRYCDFYSRGAQHSVPQEYVRAVLREIRQASACGSGALRPDTVYFGGGTPSLLAGAQVAEILNALGAAPDAEITLEANPDTVTQETLCAYRSAGVNRLSFGVQTAHDDSLRRIGRLHTAQQSRNALHMAHKAGFTNLSGDIMLALPQYSMQELNDTVTLLADGGCTHISAYMLKIEPNTAFGRSAPDGLPDDDAAADYYLAAAELLVQKGYGQYEISNFAQKGCESRHNLLYWNCEDYLGIGPAAHSCLQKKRFSMAEDTGAFIAAPAAVIPQGEVSVEDYIMLRLRLTAGLDTALLRQRYGKTFTPAQWQLLHRLADNGDAVLHGSVLALTPKGMLIQNAIVCELI